MATDDTAPLGLFIGLTTVDVVHRTTRRPGPNEKITARSQEVAAGGPAANAALTFAALGGRAVLATAVGTSPAAAVARADLQRGGVELIDAAADREYPLAISAVLVLEGSGERSIVSVDASQETVVPPPDLIRRLPLRADVVLVDGHHPALALTALEHLTSRPTPPTVILDGGRWRPTTASLLRHVDIAALSADFRLPDSGDEDGGDAMAARVMTAGPQAVVVTHGHEPVRWWSGDGRGSQPVAPVVARETSGAGDAFHGALAAAIADGAELAAAVARASDVATARVQRLGAHAWLADLERWW